jgi:hypothetical protein
VIVKLFRTVTILRILDKIELQNVFFNKAWPKGLWSKRRLIILGLFLQAGCHCQLALPVLIWHVLIVDVLLVAVLIV